MYNTNTYLLIEINLKKKTITANVFPFVEKNDSFHLENELNLTYKFFIIIIVKVVMKKNKLINAYKRKC